MLWFPNTCQLNVGCELAKELKNVFLKIWFVLWKCATPHWVLDFCFFKPGDSFSRLCNITGLKRSKFREYPMLFLK